MEKLQPFARPALIIFSCACAVALLVSFVDLPLASWAHANLRDYHPDLFIFLSEIGSPAVPVSGWGLMICGLAALCGWRPGRYGQTFIACCVASLVAHEIKDILKYAFGRTWPETWTGNNPSWIKDGVAGFHPFHGGKGYFSFPSGHTSVDTAPLAVLWIRFPRWRVLIALPIVAVMTGLLFNDYHFLGDMVGGIFVGSAIGAGILTALESDWNAAREPNAGRVSAAASTPQLPDGLSTGNIQ